MARATKKPLAGKKILVTRARHQAGEFSQMLRRLGALPVEFPVIEIRPVESSRLDRFVERFCSGEFSFNYVVFTSRNGVDDFFRRAGTRSTGARALRGCTVTAIGPKTAEALRKRGIRIRAMPEKYVAESVAEMLGAGNLKGKRILLLRAKGARDVLPRRLRQAGASVAVRSLYEAVAAGGSAQKLRRLLGTVDFVTAASGSTVRNLLKIVAGGKTPGPERARKLMGNTKLASIGPVTSRVARALGLRVDVEAQDYTMAGLADAMVEYMMSE